VRALLTGRKLIQGKLHDIEMSLRGILRGFGLKVGPTTRRTYAARIRERIERHPTLEAIAASLLKVRDALAGEFAGVERKERGIARQDESARRLTTEPGVGVLVALTFVSVVAAPERFRSSRAVGPHFGLAPKKYQSGETDYTGRISKIGDVGVRTALYEAANVILTRPVKGSDLKTWALAVARRGGTQKGAGWIGPQAGGGVASHAQGRNQLHSSQGSASHGRLRRKYVTRQAFGRAIPSVPGARSLRRDDGWLGRSEVSSTSGLRVSRLANRSSADPIQQPRRP
jgi:hypothetical protein